MGLANAERTLGYIRILTEFISQPEYVDLIPIFGLVNEALLQTIGRDNLSSLYVKYCLYRPNLF
jgi:glucan 1,3-beta-glucosidase